MDHKKWSLQIGGRVLEIETGLLARQANGSVTVRYGDTVVLAAATMSKAASKISGYFPLMVDYEERYYAAGKIKGSRFIKREGRPSDEAILTGRVVDRTVRPLFNGRMRNDVQIIVTTLSFDGENDPDTLAVIAASLEIQYGLKIKEGALQKILHNLKKKFGPKYTELIKEVQQNKIKHADETGWRIKGQNAWCWMFSSPQSIIYTIEETRGKGVPQKMLGSSPPGVLIRDDYAAYKKLDLPQQSCWSHLLRNSREKAERENSSPEMRDLHVALNTMFGELSEIIPQKMSAKKRKENHQIYKKKIQTIIDTAYTARDAQEIQTRITNQNTNLITAILYPGVPLTNNEAERNIRKMVITRKISGGSRSDNGAATHAVNMSIIQTLALKKESLVSELQKLLNPATVGLVLEKGE